MTLIPCRVVLLVLPLVVVGHVSARLFAAGPPPASQSSPEAKFTQVAGNAVSLRPVGAAKIDITPTHPVLLNGYGSRKQQVTLEVSQRLWARAVAVGSDEDKPAVLMAVDNLGIPAEMHRAVAAALAAKHGIPRSRLTINASHTHSAPMLTDVANYITSRDLTSEERLAMDRYTQQLTDKLIRVAEEALAKRTPCRLDWGKTTVGFAINRRGGGIVDHSLPVLRVTDESGKVRAVVSNYACHCVSAGSELNMCGDWAGYAAEEIEAELPGAVSLVLAGCGADQNPAQMQSLSAAKRQGHLLAEAIAALPGETMTPVLGKLDTQFAEIELPLAKPFTKEQWQSLAMKGGIVGYHASKNLARLERREAIPTSIKYPVQSWTFGDDLAAVFLAGEVVVDYAKLLGDKHDASRMWVSGYSNDAPCYIPSERILREGGYEGGDAMVCYDKPRPFAPGLEKRILDEVDRQLGDRFKKPSNLQRTGGTRALSPQQSIARMQVPDHLRVEIVAAEPLVIDPVAIDFGHDGKLWVAEMHDYPEGIDGKFQPGGRIKYLEDTNGDGVYDKATTLLEGVAFPTGVMAWRKGVLVCAAPDVLYVEDADGDGKADIVREELSGFDTGNYQGRVNSLSLGFDNWIYGAAGAFGGTIHSASSKPVDANNRDFRFSPDTGAVEAVSGRTQQGRARDDWGNWFGCDSGTLICHFPLTEHYYSRNANVAAPNPSLSVALSNRLFPRGNIVQWALSGPPGVPTSTCGLGIYRDTLLGSDFANNAFVCEPVNQLVHRMQLEPKGVTFSAKRPAAEADKEFLASTDNWFRPVQALTGPDGALYIVDMYRYLIEHPRWLSPEAKAKVDLRAGDTLGRIYRIVPKTRTLRAVPLLAKLNTAKVVAALDSPNGALRDMAHLELLWRGDASAVEPLAKLARSAELPQVRLQALSALDTLTKVTAEDVLAALGDPHPSVRRHAIRIAEKGALAQSKSIVDKLLALADDTDAQVRLQLAYSLGQVNDPRTGGTLRKFLIEARDDRYTKSAALSSLTSENVGAALAESFDNNRAKTDTGPIGIDVLSMAAKIGDKKSLEFVADKLLHSADGRFSDWQLRAMPGLLQTLARRNSRLEGTHAERWQSMLTFARKTIEDDGASAAAQVAAIALLPFSGDQADLERLTARLTPRQPLVVQQAAIKALASIESSAAIEGLFEAFAGLTPDAQATLLDEALAQQKLAEELLTRVAADSIPRTAIDPARRLALTNHPRAEIRSRAEKLFAGSSSQEIAALLKTFASMDVEQGDALTGRVAFQKHCAVCHRVGNTGFVLGPDLAALTDKSPQALLTAIVDPNAAVDRRYATYTAVTSAGLVFTGVLGTETVSNVVLKAQEGKDQSILRKDLEELRNTGKSLMPEGLAREINPRTMQDLLAFLVRGTSKFESINRVSDLLADVKIGSQQELEKIPAIWSVAIEAGRRNNADELRDMLNLALPRKDEPLSLWQAVAIGGGIVNGLSEATNRPNERIVELLSDRAKLAERWNRALELAARMADNDAVIPGFRYDALRMVALRPWDIARQQLTVYLAENANHDLQQGAISGLADIPNAEAAALLVAALRYLDPGQRDLALKGIVRTSDGAKHLLATIASQSLGASLVNDDLRKKLIDHDDPKIQEQARRLFGK